MKYEGDKYFLCTFILMIILICSYIVFSPSGSFMYGNPFISKKINELENKIQRLENEHANPRH